MPKRLKEWKEVIAMCLLMLSGISYFETRAIAEEKWIKQDKIDSEQNEIIKSNQERIEKQNDKIMANLEKMYQEILRLKK